MERIKTKQEKRNWESQNEVCRDIGEISGKCKVKTQ